MISTILISVGVFVMCLALWPFLRSNWASSKRKKRGRGISFIIPFRASGKVGQRASNVEWLKEYWRAQFPEAEVIIGQDHNLEKAFSKSVAINEGVSRSTGDVLVIIDADGYMPVEAVQHCVDEIRDARKRDKRLWFVPYRQFYRLSEEASKRILSSDPNDPYTFSNHVPSDDDVIGDTNPRTGHWYGAMVHICPREAFELVGGWDERFRGWGGEDHAAMRAMDTLYWPHKTLPGAVLHIWHPMIGGQGIDKIVHWKDRRWEGQDDPAINNQLSWRYYHAFGKPLLMRKLCDEWQKKKHHHKHHEHKHHEHHHHHRWSC